ncbi:uncharacterized protein LOC133310130 isoform X2 [Gastrolobium bilobum]|uniref:uncharacterized protein LOC133310130 isoform X2 n=1 Tax=Gastrolobium bilobum TaxID=150636 RepID=UPI002AB2D278|nr:uncharacterized protein LOC133310130 isoform X2 [Gastrolobium bilobum]
MWSDSFLQPSVSRKVGSREISSEEKKKLCLWFSVFSTQMAVLFPSSMVLHFNLKPCIIMASSRDKEQAPPHHHQPLLSSLVVRPSHSEGGGGASAGGRSGDFEPSGLHRDPPPPYSRADRYSDDPGSSTTDGLKNC